MDKYLRETPELDLVIMKLGEVKDYLLVDAPLIDNLVTETEGPTGWKYLKLQELRKFQEKQGGKDRHIEGLSTIPTSSW